MRSATGFNPSDCMRIRARSAGLPIMAAKPPAVRPAAARSLKPMVVLFSFERAERVVMKLSKKPRRAVV